MLGHVLPEKPAILHDMACDVQDVVKHFAQASVIAWHLGHVETTFSV